MAAESQILTKPRSAAEVRLWRNEPARTKQHLLCKTKPISKALPMNLTSALTSTYEHKPPLEAPKNKANSKPIGKKAKMSLTAYVTKAYEKNPRRSRNRRLVYMQRAGMASCFRVCIIQVARLLPSAKSGQRLC